MQWNRFNTLILSFLIFSAPLFSKQQEIALQQPEVFKNFYLDDETAVPSYFGSRAQYVAEKNQLAYWNSVSRSIKYFDYTSGASAGGTLLQKEGPNGIIGTPFYFEYVSEDSIFVFSDFDNHSINLINRAGKLVRKYRFERPSNLPYPSLTKVFGGMVHQNNSLYLALRISDQPKMNTVAPILRLDLKTSLVNYLDSPLPYTTQNYDRIPQSGQFEFYQSRITPGNSPNELIVSYPLEKQFYKLKNERVAKTYSIEGLESDIVVLSKNKQNFSTKSPKYKSEVLGSPRSMGLLKSNNGSEYYHLRKLDKTNEWFKKLSGNTGKPVFQTYELTVYDTAFTKKNTIYLSSEHFRVDKLLFTAPDGLWTLYPSEEEDKMTLVRIWPQSDIIAEQ